MSESIKKLKEAYYQRMPVELRKELNMLDAETQTAILKALDAYHHVFEEKTYEFTLELIKALCNEP